MLHANRYAGETVKFRNIGKYQMLSKIETRDRKDAEGRRLTSFVTTLSILGDENVPLGSVKKRTVVR